MHKRPTWATVVGIIGIVLSGFGILGAGQTIIMPKMLEFQKQMFTQMAEEMERDAAEKGAPAQGVNAGPHAMPPKKMFEMMQKMWNLPEWFSTWSVIAGLFQLLISGFYLLSCIWLLQMKPASINMFYCAAGTKILLGIVNGVVAIMASSLMIMMMMAWGVVGIVFHIVLLIVVASGNKEAFFNE
jgi:hypothetical protein